MNKEKFIEELEKLDIKITKSQMEQLDEYYHLLKEWNQKINLTSIIEEKEVYLKHFYDSATLNKIINLSHIETLCDIGTGAGFPGIVLKILFPHLKITLVDSLNKRIEFLNIVIDKLNLKNIQTIHERAEEFSRKNQEKYDVVTARAVSHLAILLEYCAPAIKINGFFIAMKANISEELKESKNAMNLLKMKLIQKVEFNLPIENSKRTLLKIQKLEKTPFKYPRKYIEIKKKRL